jgi:hypothetical protein
MLTLRQYAAKDHNQLPGQVFCVATQFRGIGASGSSNHGVGELTAQVKEWWNE